MAQFDYIINVTGDCSSVGVGVVSILPTGGTEPYTVEWIDPNLGADIVTTEPSIREGLYPGTYGIRINDSTLPINQEFYVNIPVSSGICVNIIGVNKTTCGLDNGSVTATTTSEYSSTNFYLYTINDVFISSGTSNTSEYVFNALSADTYYIVGQDLGGCEGKSQSFIIDESTDFDFGLYIVPNSGCGGGVSGKLYVTGQTGTSPYTYIWNTGALTSYITGLTAGSYSVEVTDANGCSLTKSATIENIPPPGLVLFTATPPTCLKNDGAITMTITGGTAPFYYSASTGYVEITYSNIFTISGLSAGEYAFFVTDAGFCTLKVGTSLESPTGMGAVNVITKNSTCSSDNGEIAVSVIGGTAPFTYTLIDSSGNTINITTIKSLNNFTRLNGGTYTIIVTDSNGCSFTEEVYLITENKFTISGQIINTSCGGNNGSIDIVLSSGGEEPYYYYIDNVAQAINTTLTAFTFTNVSGGQHLITVVDNSGCAQNKIFFVEPSEPVDFSLFYTSCGNGNNGTITAFITEGKPPFQFYWSDNVLDNPQEIKITGLTAGTYSLTVVDSDNCSLKRTVVLDCNQLYSSYQTYLVGSEQFQLELGTKCGLLQMLNQGFIDLTSGDTGCTLISAEFVAQVSVQPLGNVYTQPFYTTNSLFIPPPDNLWYDTVKALLLSIPGIIEVTIDALNNKITIASDGETLNGQNIIVELIINYDITCEGSAAPITTPTATPVINVTPTTTVTIGLTPTPTETIEVTPTPTSTEIPICLKYDVYIDDGTGDRNSYMLYWTDCNGNPQERNTVNTQTYPICTNDSGSITGDYVDSITFVGTCGTPIPTAKLYIYTKYVNSSGNLQFNINGASEINIGAVTTTSCNYQYVINGLDIGDVVTFTDTNTKVLSGNNSNCINTGFGCSYIVTISSAGANYVYLTIDGSTIC